MKALVSLQGTAISPGLCDEHYPDAGFQDEVRVLVNAPDVDITSPFVDVTGNDEVVCMACGIPPVVADEEDG